ncbi:discoidin domain-containing protein [Polymorphospora rubra]|uniref:discoidin domain-containing protein n=1 Tax=Polymorphospora rubra TaxID=338584 RepID=UPI0031DC62A4
MTAPADTPWPTDTRWPRRRTPRDTPWPRRRAPRGARRPAAGPRARRLAGRGLLGGLLVAATALVGGTATAADVPSDVVPAIPGCTTAVPATATANTHEAANPPPRAVDGDLGTRWSGEGFGAQLTLDLGTVRDLCGIRVAWHLGDLRWNDFTVYTSTDGAAFTKVWAGRSTGTTAGFESSPFAAPTGARFVRVAWWASAQGNGWASVGEVAALVADPEPGPGAEHVVVAAGDIATRCTGTSCAHWRTSELALALDPDAVLVLGDNQNNDGTFEEYQAYYEPSWGRLKNRTRPTPGNHEYILGDGAQGYFRYFGDLARPNGTSWYSFDLGNWHVVSLNSEYERSASGPQVAWLKADLAANTKRCVLAFWHRPMFSSGGTHGNFPNMRPFWDALYAAGADLVLNGHDHSYERFGPQTPDAVAAPAGIREFVVGTGGAAPREFGTVRANSELRLRVNGVLKLTLGADSYSWQFVDVDGAVLDAGGPVGCH